MIEAILLTVILRRLSIAGGCPLLGIADMTSGNTYARSPFWPSDEVIELSRSPVLHFTWMPLKAGTTYSCVVIGA